MSAWWTGIAPAEAPVQCGDHTHTLRWERGTLTAVDHDDPEAEATLAALAGEPAPCLTLLRAWAHRRDDARVLTIASRGVLDPLDITINRRPHPRAPAPRRGETELLELLALGGGIPDRLQAHAAATWTRRAQTGHASLHATVPQLHAALYGRVLAALRLWLDEPNLPIDLTMIDPASKPHLQRTDTAIAVSLPFAWLSNVWARGLSTIFGRLCLQANTADGDAWTLETIGPDLGATAQITISLPEPPTRTQR
jgi:hypothetical protein